MQQMFGTSGLYFELPEDSTVEEDEFHEKPCYAQPLEMLLASHCELRMGRTLARKRARQTFLKGTCG